MHHVVFNPSLEHVVWNMVNSKTLSKQKCMCYHQGFHSPIHHLWSLSMTYILATDIYSKGCNFYLKDWESNLEKPLAQHFGFDFEVCH